MRALDLHHGVATDTGRVRKVNEDSYLVAPPVFVVADGMGGHHGGAVASTIVTDEFSRLDVAGLDVRAGAELLVATMARCQARIRAWAQTRDTGTGWQAGTTVVVAMAVEETDGFNWLLANLGDSRIYRVYEGELDQVSVDHSVVQELMDAGQLSPEQALTHPERHVITKALGGPEGIQPDFFLLPLASVERLVLCSDGISGMIDDARMAWILQEHADPRDAADRLVQAALDAGGRDNATAIVVDVVGLMTDDTYDAVHRRTGLETKLGALP